VVALRAAQVRRGSKLSVKSVCSTQQDPFNANAVHMKTSGCTGVALLCGENTVGATI